MANFLKRKYLLAIMFMCTLIIDSGVTLMRQGERLCGILVFVVPVICYMIVQNIEDLHLLRIKVSYEDNNLSMLSELRRELSTLLWGLVELSIILFILILFTSTDSLNFIITAIGSLSFLLALGWNFKTLYEQEIDAAKPKI